MTKKTDTQLGKIEREYVIPLRDKCRHVPRYKKTPKAVKEIKVFLAQHMRIRDRDLNKIKIDKLVNEYMWARGIKNPMHKVKVRAVKDEKTGIVKVELVNLPNKLKFKKLRADKLSNESKKVAEHKKKEKVETETPETQAIKAEEKKEKKSEQVHSSTLAVADASHKAEKRAEKKEAEKELEQHKDKIEKKHEIKKEEKSEKNLDKKDQEKHRKKG